MERLVNLIIALLQRSLVRTNDIESDKDRQILYTKFIESMSKVASIKHSDEKSIMSQLNGEVGSLTKYREIELTNHMRALMAKVQNAHKKF